MRQHGMSAALVCAAAMILTACSPGPGSGNPTGTGGTSATTPTGSAPTSPSPAANGASPAPTAMGSEDLGPNPSSSYAEAVPTPGAGNAELSILVKASPDAAPQSYTLVCRDGSPAAESKHPTASAACSALKENPALLERSSKTGQPCTQQYGGPQTATVTGAVDGKAVESSYSLTDGCEINAWNAVKDILGSAGGAS